VLAGEGGGPGKEKKKGEEIRSFPPFTINHPVSPKPVRKGREEKEGKSTSHHLMSVT